MPALRLIPALAETLAEAVVQALANVLEWVRCRQQSGLPGQAGSGAVWRSALRAVDRTRLGRRCAALVDLGREGGVVCVTLRRRVRRQTLAREPRQAGESLQ